MSGALCLMIGAGGGPFAVSLPDGASGFGSGEVVTSEPVPVSITGGSGSFSFVWNFVSGTAMTLTDPTSKTTSFFRSMAPDTSVSGTYTCTVTDTLTLDVLTTNPCTITLTRL